MYKCIRITDLDVTLIIEHKDRDEEHADDKTKQPCVGAFGSFSAQMNDGICLSVSTFGNSGQVPGGRFLIR